VRLVPALRGCYDGSPNIWTGWTLAVLACAGQQMPSQRTRCAAAAACRRAAATSAGALSQRHLVGSLAWIRFLPVNCAGYLCRASLHASVLCCNSASTSGCLGHRCCRLGMASVPRARVYSNACLRAIIPATRPFVSPPQPSSRRPSSISSLPRWFSLYHLVPAERRGTAGVLRGLPATRFIKGRLQAAAFVERRTTGWARVGGGKGALRLPAALPPVLVMAVMALYGRRLEKLPLPPPALAATLWY